MKFDKFGAFPKTQSPSSPKKNGFELSSILNLLPSLLSSKRKDEPEKKQDQAPSDSASRNPYTPQNAVAYAEFISRHDAFVEQVKPEE